MLPHHTRLCTSLLAFSSKAIHQLNEMGIRRSWSLHQASKSWLRPPHDHVSSKKLAIACLEMYRSEWFLADHLTAAWLCLKHKIFLSETEGTEFGCLMQWMKSAVLNAHQDLWHRKADWKLATENICTRSINLVWSLGDGWLSFQLCCDAVSRDRSEVLLLKKGCCSQKV